MPTTSVPNRIGTTIILMARRKRFENGLSPAANSGVSQPRSIPRPMQMKIHPVRPILRRFGCAAGVDGSTVSNRSSRLEVDGGEQRMPTRRELCHTVSLEERGALLQWRQSELVVFLQLPARDRLR